MLELNVFFSVIVQNEEKYIYRRLYFDLYLLEIHDLVNVEIYLKTIKLSDFLKV